MKKPSARRAGISSYKTMIPSQLRTLVEVARCGSQSAAARAVGLSQATVWEQLHALEHHFQVPLLEVKGRVCRLTPQGEELVQLVLPVLETLETLPTQLRERCGQQPARFSIAASPRVVQEDLLPCLREFQQRFPDAHISLQEFDDDVVSEEVLNRRADLGFTPTVPTREQSRFVRITESYDVDNYLLTPKRHPLARQREIRPEDILNYRVLNGHGTFYGPRMQAIESMVPHSPANASRVTGYYVFTIRMMVKAGFGIGIVPRRASCPADPQLHERNLSAFLGRSSVNAIERRGASHPLTTEFLRIVCDLAR
jgi:molybdate transport repressor ModE-like protein